jgi:hypothetical protein
MTVNTRQRSNIGPTFLYGEMKKKLIETMNLSELNTYMNNFAWSHTIFFFGRSESKMVATTGNM